MNNLSLDLLEIKYVEKIIQIKRVTKVVTGGKKMTFRVVVIIGDLKNKVGIGVGHAEDVNLAIKKAILNGQKNLITIFITYSYSIPYIVYISYGACKIMLRPAVLGTGLKAGGSIRTILELAGFQNVLTKQFGSNNILNNAKATLLGLIFLNKKINLINSQKSFYYKKKYLILNDYN